MANKYSTQNHSATQTTKTSYTNQKELTKKLSQIKVKRPKSRNTLNTVTREAMPEVTSLTFYKAVSNRDAPGVLVEDLESTILENEKS